MTQPTDPGTVPQVEQLSRSVLSGLSQTLAFPNAGVGAVLPSGPVGARAEDVPEWLEAPRLGYQGFPGGLRTLTLVSNIASPFLWVPYTVTRPCVLMPFRSTIPNAETGIMTLRFSPASSAQSIVGADVNSRHGFRSQRLAAYLSAPGRWLLSLGGAADTRTIDFVEIPAEDRTVAESLLARADTGQEGLVQVQTTALAAATAANVLEMNVALFLDYLRVVNAGANPVNLKWSGTPTALDGFRIAPQAFIDFPPWAMSVARLRGFSTAGTTVEVWGVRRQWSA